MKATYWLTLAEIAAYLITMSTNFASAISLLGFSYAGLLRGAVWTLLTSIFVHVDVFHLAFNLFFLLAFGPTIERELGPRRILGIFFAGGVVSLILGIPFYPSDTHIVGASIAVSTLMGASLAVVKLDKPSSPILFYAPLGLVATIYVIFNAFMLAYNQSGGVAWPSHVIGFVVGLSLGIVLRRRIHQPPTHLGAL